MTSIISTVWTDITTFADQIYSWLQNFFNTIVPAEVTALAPFAEQAVEEAAESLPTLITGGLSAFATAVAPILLATAQKAEAAGITAASSSLITAVGGAVANAAAAQVSAGAGTSGLSTSTATD